jgi:hypothetical protein
MAKLKLAKSEVLSTQMLSKNEISQLLTYETWHLQSLVEDKELHQISAQTTNLPTSIGAKSLRLRSKLSAFARASSDVEVCSSRSPQLNRAAVERLASFLDDPAQEFARVCL